MILAALVPLTTVTCAAVAEPVPPPAADPFGPDWWKGRVFYEVFVRSFADSTTGPLAHDGIGDLRGLIQRLDYLNDADPTTTTDLGVTGLWLMPIMQSPTYHGYDITDYNTVEADYGTNDDFRELVRECERRGIGVVIDMVINHTSSDHPWFQAARDPASDRRDWYIWSDADPGWKGAWGQQCWHPLQRRGRPARSTGAASTDAPATEAGPYYFGLFWHRMPDLNARHPGVTAALHDMGRFWLADMGAHGFRLDAIRHLIEEGQDQSNTPSTLAWLVDYNAHLKSVRPGAFTVGEVWDDTPTIARYLPASLDSAFEFQLAEAILAAANGHDGAAQRLADRIDAVHAAYPPGSISTFLTNHDIERVMTKLGVQRGQSPTADHTARAALAATILLTLPGVPFIYYGEEIGMTGGKPDEHIRTPMQWTPDPRRAGFTTATPWQAINPDAADGISVEAQHQDPGSLLSHYRALVHLRARDAALRSGDVSIVAVDAGRVLVYARSMNGRTVYIVANCGPEPAPMPDAITSLDVAPALRDALAGAALAGAAPARDAPAGEKDADETGAAAAASDPLRELAPWQARVLTAPPAGE